MPALHFIRYIILPHSDSIKGGTIIISVLKGDHRLSEAFCKTQKIAQLVSVCELESYQMPERATTLSQENTRAHT